MDNLILGSVRSIFFPFLQVNLGVGQGGTSGTTILTSNFLILKNYSVRILGGTFFIPLYPTILHWEITILNFAQIGHIALPPALVRLGYDHKALRNSLAS